MVCRQRARLRRYLETPAPGFDLELWAELAKLGAVLAALPEDLDGGGAGVRDLAVAVEEAGRAFGCHTSPYAAARRSAGLLVPPTQIGGCGDWAGRVARSPTR